MLVIIQKRHPANMTTVKLLPSLSCTTLFLITEVNHSKWRLSNLSFSRQCHIFILPENVRKPKVFWQFQGIEMGNWPEKGWLLNKLSLRSGVAKPRPQSSKKQNFATTVNGQTPQLLLQSYSSYGGPGETCKYCIYLVELFCRVGYTNDMVLVILASF